MASSIYTEIRKRIEALKIGAVLLCNLFNFADYDVSAFINIASLTVKYHRCNSVNKTILYAAGRIILQYTIRYFHTFLTKISSLVSIICYMRYHSMIIYENKCIRIYARFLIL